MINKLHKILGESVKENILLRDFTTFKIGGPARYFFIAESEEEISKAIKAAKELNLPYFILGGGSNVLVSDEGFKGFVIKIQSLMRGSLTQNFHTWKYGSFVSNLEIRGNFIEAAAGVSLQVLVQEAAKAGLSGLEQATGIPGTLGGAIYGNAGGRYWAMGDVVKSVKILWPASRRLDASRGGPDGKIETVSKDWMEFGYRESKLKKIKSNGRLASPKPGEGGPVILSAVLELAPGKPDEIKKIIAEKTAGREQKLPKEPSAGCVFKNPEGIFAPSNDGVQSTGQLISSLGLKGKCVGGACVSNLHGNFIINKGNATAKDVKELIELIKKTVKEKKGIRLEEEIQYLGF